MISWAETWQYLVKIFQWSLITIFGIFNFGFCGLLSVVVVKIVIGAFSSVYDNDKDDED